MSASLRESGRKNRGGGRGERGEGAREREKGGESTSSCCKVYWQVPLAVSNMTNSTKVLYNPLNHLQVTCIVYSLLTQECVIVSVWRRPCKVAKLRIESQKNVFNIRPVFAWAVTIE